MNVLLIEPVVVSSIRTFDVENVNCLWVFVNFVVDSVVMTLSLNVTGNINPATNKKRIKKLFN